MHKFIFIISLFSMTRTVETRQIFGIIYDTHESPDTQLNTHIRITKTSLTSFLQL